MSGLVARGMRHAPCRSRDRPAPGPRSSARHCRARSCVTTAVRLPPALSPPTKTRLVSMPNLAALSTIHCVAAMQSTRGRRKLVLGRKAVVDREHHEARLIGDLPADDVVAVEVADHPAAAMVEDQRGRRGSSAASSACRREPESCPSGAGTAMFSTEASSGGSGWTTARPSFGGLARFRRRQRLVFRPVGGPERLHHECGARVEYDRHACSSGSSSWCRSLASAAGAVPTISFGLVS